MSETEIVLACDRKWGRSDVQRSLARHGASRQVAPNLLHVVESLFACRAATRGCRAEWSITRGEVTGRPEDLQFDIDALRDEAIQDAALRG